MTDRLTSAETYADRLRPYYSLDDEIVKDLVVEIQREAIAATVRKLVDPKVILAHPRVLEEIIDEVMGDD
jgi:hypothetical protein